MGRVWARCGPWSGGGRARGPQCGYRCCPVLRPPRSRPKPQRARPSGRYSGRSRPHLHEGVVRSGPRRRPAPLIPGRGCLAREEKKAGSGFAPALAAAAGFAPRFIIPQHPPDHPLAGAPRARTAAVRSTTVLIRSIPHPTTGLARPGAKSEPPAWSGPWIETVGQSGISRGAWAGVLRHWRPPMRRGAAAAARGCGAQVNWNPINSSGAAVGGNAAAGLNLLGGNGGARPRAWTFLVMHTCMEMASRAPEPPPPQPPPPDQAYGQCNDVTERLILCPWHRTHNQQYPQASRKGSCVVAPVCV